MLFICDYDSMKLEIILYHTFYGVMEMQVYKKIDLENIKDNLWLLQIFLVKIKDRLPIYVMFYMKLVTAKTFWLRIYMTT